MITPAGPSQQLDSASIAAHVARTALLGDRSAPTPAAATATAEQLVAAVHNAATPTAIGAALRQLDAFTGSRVASAALLRAPGQAVPVPTPTPPPFGPGALYGPNGQPSIDDVRQSSFGDCYYAATLAAIAQQNPDLIRNAIRYDPATQTYSVTLHDASGAPQTLTVSQAEIASNIAMGGGGQRDDGVANAPVWVDVMEVAYAKMLDTNHADGLTEGYTDLGDGGWPHDAMRVLTGSEGAAVAYDKGLFESRGHALDEMGTAVQDALNNGRPVTAWSVPERDSRSLWGRITGAENPQDGLVDDHVYTVTAIARDANGNWQVTLRNPWAHNNAVGENADSNSATITVPLDRLVRTGGLESFQVGS